MTLPTGGTVSYTYDDEIFDVGCQSSTVARVTLKTRTTAGRDVSSGTWTYSYSLPGKDGMTTTITGPSGSGYSETHVFEGYGPYTGSDVTLWSIGRPRSRAVSNGLQTVTETFDWVEGDVLSSDFRFTSNWLSCGSNRSDAQIRFVRPDEVERTVNRSGKTWVTTQSNFDAYGHPQTITENGDLFRTTTFTYFYDTGLNILDGRVERRTPSPGEITENEYDSSGRVVREELNPAASSPDDVETIYAYDSTGNLTSRTVNNGSLDRLTEYPSGNYSFGLPEVERIYKDIGSYTIDRNATPLGLVDWEEDGRGGSTYRTSFAYDKLGRTTLVDPPLGHSTAISFTSDSSVATVNRGQYITKYSFDGFGRLRKWEDTETGNRREIIYDNMGRKTQEAYFVGGLAADVHFFDSLGRRTQVRHPDSSSVFYDYDREDVTVDDELARSTELDYSAFGDPDDRRLERVIDADFEIWDYQYNSSSGKLSRVVPPSGNSFDREFLYTSKGWPDYEEHPETGRIELTYSPAGDLTFRSKGGISVNFEYTRHGLLKKIDPPSTASDVTFTYNDAGLRELVSNSVATIDPVWDAAQRLDQMTVTLSGIPRTIDYAYTDHDWVSSITYPSGRMI